MSPCGTCSGELPAAPAWKFGRHRIVAHNWFDFPASYHNHAGGFSFADGHSEIKRWVDARTFPKLAKGVPLPLNQPSPNNPDAFWMMDHSTRKL